MTTCLFCKIAEKSIPSRIVFENEAFLAFRDNNPQAPTHVLIIPKTHISTINDAQDSDAMQLGQMVLMAKHVAQLEGLDETGYRLVFNVNQAGGQTVFHIHLHVLGGRPMTWPPG